MTQAPEAFTADMAIAGVVLVAAYVLIFTEVLHRTSAAIVGAVAMIGIGMLRGFYTQEEAILAIDGNTIFLLAAMMMVVALLRPTGTFEYAAIRLTKLARGDSRLLLVYLCLAVSLISMILDNVTTVIIFAPLTILITRLMRLNPIPYLIAEAMLSNIGGAATLVGDPPNIMIGSEANIDFTRFLVHMAPPIAVIWVVSVLLLLAMFRNDLPSDTRAPAELDEERAIKDPAATVRALSALALIVIAFFVHHRLHFSPAYGAFIGLAVALVLLQPKPDELFGEVNWSVLIFFGGLFVLVGGVEATGLLELIGRQLAAFAESGRMLATALLLMWVAAILSAIVDNIPFTVAMLPIISGLTTQGLDTTPLWWALAIGVGLGGNGTHIGATANLIVLAEAEKLGNPATVITPVSWLRKGIPTMFVSLTVASVVFAMFFEFFAG